MKEVLKNRRMGLCAGVLSLLYAAMLVIGIELQKNGAFVTPAWKLLLFFFLAAILFLVAVWALLALCQCIQRREGKEPGRFGRLIGHPAVVFLFLIACWLPAWLAFWPGTFPVDALTQFQSFIYRDPSAHHPLLHTTLLGGCMAFGILVVPGGSAACGLAIYSCLQMMTLAACVAYGCWWLKKRGAPVWSRLLVLLLIGLGPFYAPWAFSAQKDVLFAALVLVFCLQLIDLWQYGMKPKRCIAFAAIAVLMMLFRNNGIYALCLLLPFAAWWAQKGRKARTALLLAACAAVYLVVNGAVIFLVNAKKVDRVEMLSIPLQQIARTLRDHPEAIELDEEGVLTTLYGEVAPAEIYDPVIADPIKWAVDYASLEEEFGSLLRLWARMCVRYPQSFFEAALVQNLPYYMPYSKMLIHLDMNVSRFDRFPIEEHSYLPGLRAVYEEYDRTLTFAGLPGTRFLSDIAVFVWLCLFGFGYAVYSRQKQMMTAFAFLLAIWLTCLLGPVAIIRYMLSFFYAVPFLLCIMLAPNKPKEAAEGA